jgi:hypothetical protein
LLCPQTFFLALALADNAFVAKFESAIQIFRLKLRPDQNELQLLFEDSMADIPIFRTCERALNGIQVSPDRPLTDAFIRSMMKKAAKITGINVPVGPYTFRRGAGEAFDHSGKYYLW